MDSSTLLLAGSAFAVFLMVAILSHYALTARGTQVSGRLYTNPRTDPRVNPNLDRPLFETVPCSIGWSRRPSDGWRR